MYFYNLERVGDIYWSILIKFVDMKIEQIISPGFFFEILMLTRSNDVKKVKIKQNMNKSLYKHFFKENFDEI